MELAGVYVPLVTPFAADGSVALGALASLGSEALDAGASGLVQSTLGTGTAVQAPPLGHVKPDSTCEQSAEQPSPETVLPSSHDSPMSRLTTPSPQNSIFLQAMPGTGQV